MQLPDAKSMKLSRAFTLVELMVGVAITMLIGGGALVYINNFNTQNKVDEVKSQIESAFRIARNYAVTMQKPVNYSGDLNYVRVSFDEDRVVVWPNREVGVSYMNQEFYDSSIGVSSTVGDIYFSAYSGNLMRYDPERNIVENIGANQSAVVVINSQENNSYSSQVILDYMGLTGRSNSYLISPTLAPTAGPMGEPTLKVDPPAECSCHCTPPQICEPEMGCLCHM